MQEETIDHTLSPEEPGTPEPILPVNVTSKPAASEDEANAQGRVPCPSLERPEPVKQLGRIEESVRGEDGAFGTVHIQFSVRPESVTLLQEMIARGEYARDPWKQIPFPTETNSYGTTTELITSIKQAIAEQTQLSEENSSLLTYWALSTWFQDILPLAPGLAISGSAHEGDVALRTLRAFCYHPVLVAGITNAILNDVRWERKPTLLISDPNLVKRMAVLLGSSTRRGYLAFRKVAGCPAFSFDYYCSKAIFLGEDSRMVSAMQPFLHINASLAPGVELHPAPPLSEKMTQNFQNQLLLYRATNLLHVYQAEFKASGLSSEVTSIANALGGCIVDAPALQAELVSLLTPYSRQQIEERLDDLGTLAVGAALSLCHQGKVQILVGEIAAEVNRVLKGRGERLQFSPEKVGHSLKKAGLLSRRMGAAGNGFQLDNATQVLLHKVAAAYGCVGLTENNQNLHCQLCNKNK
jgi:hypothetical protein